MIYKIKNRRTKFKRTIDRVKELRRKHVLIREHLQATELIDDDYINYRWRAKPFKYPADFNVAEFLSLGFKDKHIANVLFLLGFIQNITMYRRVVLREKEYMFASINSVVLQKFLLTLDDETKAFLTKLEAANWITIDHSYQAGRKSKGYRIGPRFEFSKWVLADWRDTLNKFVPRIQENSYIGRNRDTLYDMWLRSGLALLSWRDMPESDLKDMCRRLESLGVKLKINYGPELDDTILTCAAETVARPDATLTLLQQAQNYYDSLARIHRGDFAVSCHDESRFEKYTNRIYNNLVNLKSELRDFLTYEGQTFVNVDIQSCQMALLTSFYLDADPNEIAERRRYINLICDADIYTFLAQNRPRDSAKTGVFKIIFGKNCHQSGTICASFKRHFPILAQRIYDIKAQYGHREVARLMQLKESDIVIRGALFQALMVNDFPCFSIHDSIFCLAVHASNIQIFLRDSFQRIMGFCPPVFVRNKGL